MNVWLVVATVVGALLLSALGGSPLTAAVLRLAARSADAGDGPTRARRPAHPRPDPRRRPPGRRPAPRDDEGPPGGDGPDGEHAREVLRGGTWIGVLERAAVTGCLLAGYPAGIAFVIAVKGLGRYPELREHPGASERFVIGTFASLLWAGGVGLAGAALL